MGMEDLLAAAISSGKKPDAETLRKAGLQERNTNKLVQAVQRFREKGQSYDAAIRTAYAFTDWDQDVPVDQRYQYEDFLRRDFYKAELEEEKATAPKPQKRAA